MPTTHPAADLDGPVAAPDHHRVAFENDRVRVLETTIRVGDTAPLHTHLQPHLIVVLSGDHFVRRDAGGATMLDTRATERPFTMPPYMWNDGTPAHTLENVGSEDIVLVSVELKPAGTSPADGSPR